VAFGSSVGFHSPAGAFTAGAALVVDESGVGATGTVEVLVDTSADDRGDVAALVDSLT